MNKEKEKENAALAAVALIEDHMVVGLGTGSTAYYAIMAIAEKVKKEFADQSSAYL